MTASPLGFLHELKISAVSPWDIHHHHHHPHHYHHYPAASLRSLLVRTKGPLDVTLRDSASSPSSLPTQPALLLRPLRTRRCSFAHQAAILDTPTSVPKISFVLPRRGGGGLVCLVCARVAENKFGGKVGKVGGTVRLLRYVLLVQQKS